MLPFSQMPLPATTKVESLCAEYGNRFLFERLFDDPRAIMALGSCRVITRVLDDPHDPEVALEFPIALPDGQVRKVVTVFDWSQLHALLGEMERRYGRWAGVG